MLLSCHLPECEPGRFQFWRGPNAAQLLRCPCADKSNAAFGRVISKHNQLCYPCAVAWLVYVYCSWVVPCSWCRLGQLGFRSHSLDKGNAAFGLAMFQKLVVIPCAIALLMSSYCAWVVTLSWSCERQRGLRPSYFKTDLSCYPCALVLLVYLFHCAAHMLCVV